MMFQYWLNKDGRHTELLFTCEANTILEADQQFQEITGLNSRTPWIGCIPIPKEKNQ